MLVRSARPTPPRFKKMRCFACFDFLISQKDVITNNTPHLAEGRRELFLFTTMHGRRFQRCTTHTHATSRPFHAAIIADVADDAVAPIRLPKTIISHICSTTRCLSPTCCTRYRRRIAQPGKFLLQKVITPIRRTYNAAIVPTPTHADIAIIYRAGLPHAISRPIIIAI